MQYDTVIVNGRWFDGTGAPSAVRNIGVRNGRVAAVAAGPLDTTGADVIDATGQWVIPGIIDIHTHYDIETLCEPELSESLRHGVTTVMLGSCSLSTVYLDNVDAGDIFGRVEAIPRQYVIEQLDEGRSWKTPREYVAALEGLNLGPNLAAFIGHSDMRAATMGLDRATRKDVRPSPAELARMESMLEEALDEGFVGMSSQQLLFDKLDGEVCRSRTLPSTYATSRELRRLNAILRRRNKILQSGPDIKNPLSIFSQLAASLGVGRRRLKTSLLSAADVKSLPPVIYLMDVLARIVNALGGDFRWQHLPVPFEVYADGISLVIFEEFGSGAAALHLQDEIARNELMRDEEYRRQFRKDYDQKYRAAGLAPGFLRRRHRRLPRRFGGRQVIRPSRSGSRRPAPGRRFPRSGAGARRTAALAHHDLRPPPRNPQKAGTEPQHPDGLFRCRRTPAQHGVLQLRTAAIAPRPRRGEAGQAVPVDRAGGAPAHRRTGVLVRDRCGYAARRRPRRHRRHQPRQA